MSLHNLTSEQFDAIATKSWKIIKVIIVGNESDPIRFNWTFEY